MSKLSRDRFFNKPQTFSLLISIRESCFFCFYLVKTCIQKLPYITSEPNKLQKLSPSKSFVIHGKNLKCNKLTYYHLKTRRCVQVKPLLIYCYSMYYNSS